MADLLGFDTVGVLTLVPSQTISVGVHGASNVHHVRISLEGAYGDASIDLDRIVLDDRGQGSFTLRAPSMPSTFGVRATSDEPDATARLDVAVSNDGFASLKVSPRYRGARPAPLFVVSAFVRTTCKEIDKTDGSPVRTGDGLVPIELPSVPAGGNVAVAARISHYAFGCTDIADLAPNGSKSVSVDLYDKPLDLGALDLEARLTFTPSMSELAAWNARMDAAAQIALSKFSPYGTAQDEAQRLLDAMQSAAQNVSFAGARQNGTWDYKAMQWLSQHAPSMRTRAQTWLASGQPATTADLFMHLGSSSMSQKAVVTPAPDTKDAGITTATPFSVVVDAMDTLRIEGPIDVLPSALVTHAANAQAALDVKTASDVPTALAIQLDCDGLASTLLNGQSFAYGMCDKSCLKQLCESGLGAMWSAARDVSQKIGDGFEILVNGSGPVTVGDAAEPIKLIGTWSGQVKGGPYTTSTMHGDLKAGKGMAP